MISRVTVGGTLQATHDSAADRFSGSFSNAAGKVEVSEGGCRYFIAASGSFQAWGAQAQQPADFSLTASDSTTPTLRWTALATGTRYTVRVFDHACVQADPADVACFLGESFATTALASDYPADFLAGAATLQVGREYLAIVTAQDPATSAFTGFASLPFTPARVADPDAGGGPGGGGGDDGGSDSGGALGSLTITGASMGERFAPSSTPQGTVHINASGPSFTANTGLYGSGLALTWEERDVLGGVSRAVQLFLSSVTSQAPGATPGEGVTVAAATYSQLLPTAQQASYHRQCGEPASILVACPAVALLGVQWDLVARTVRFTDTVLPSTGPATHTVVLNGTLRY